MAHNIAVIGAGKIATDQHLPVIGRTPAFRLAAIVDPRPAANPAVPVFASTEALFATMPEIEAVAICTPPAVRHAIARAALLAGKDVLTEKPPATTVSEFDDLKRLAAERGRVLFQAWHSRENVAVDRARALLAEEGVQSLRIDWRESVRKWHPGQDWVWQPGGFGVFDPGINALSIVTAILPFAVVVSEARLAFPANRQTPVDARLRLRAADGQQAEITAHFNWLEEAGEIWSIGIETRSGRRVRLERGGTVLEIDGATVLQAPFEEYERLYARFAACLAERRSEVDDAPLRLVADAFMLGARDGAPPFHW